MMCHFFKFVLKTQVKPKTKQKKSSSLLFYFSGGMWLFCFFRKQHRKKGNSSNLPKLFYQNDLFSNKHREKSVLSIFQFQVSFFVLFCAQNYYQKPRQLIKCTNKIASLLLPNLFPKVKLLVPLLVIYLAFQSSIAPSTNYPSSVAAGSNKSSLNTLS